jgi:hypothetical protein
MRINVLSVGHTGYIVKGFNMVIDELRSRNYQVDHYCMDMVDWYKDDIHTILFCKNIQWSKVPRPSGNISSWWYTKDIIKEAISALPEIERYLDSVVKLFNPKVLFVGDDQGLIEKYIIKYANSKGIVVFLFEHGPGFTYQSDRNKTLWFYSYQKTLNFSKLILKKILNHSSLCYDSTYLTCIEQKINQFGKNGNNVICAYSTETSKIMAKSGIDERKIYNTGFPYWDIIFNFNKKKIEEFDEKNRQRKKILLISTGRSKNNSNVSSCYYRFCVDFYNKYMGRYDIFIRLKPGEKDFSCGIIPLSDNSIDSYMQIKDFDLIVGEFSSLLWEAIIIGKPIILYRAKNKFLKKYRRNAEGQLKRYLNPLTVNQFTDINDKLFYNAFNGIYIDRLQKRMNVYLTEIFNGLDGYSSSRISDLIIKQLDV